MTRTERRRRQQRRRRAAMQRAACLALALLAVAAAFAWSGRPQEPETPEATVPVTATALPAETPALEPITLEFEDREAIDPMEASKVALAKMVWGEARGCSTTEQAATIWCVLNRYDSGDRFWADTVEGITTQPCQFYGYDPSNRWTRTSWPWWRMCWPAGWPRRSAWAAWAGCCRRSTCTSPETAHTTTSPRNGKAGRPGTGPWKARMRDS